jgi:hypothetical protein
LKYSHKIICLDADEYLDGPLTKQELEEILDNNIDTVFHLNWIQYTSLNTIRVDGPWKNNIKDRIGSYTGKPKFEKKQMLDINFFFDGSKFEPPLPKKLRKY